MRRKDPRVNHIKLTISMNIKVVKFKITLRKFIMELAILITGSNSDYFKVSVTKLLKFSFYHFPRCL